METIACITDGCTNRDLCYDRCRACWDALRDSCGDADHGDDAPAVPLVTGVPGVFTAYTEEAHAMELHFAETIDDTDELVTIATTVAVEHLLACLAEGLPLAPQQITAARDLGLEVPADVLAERNATQDERCRECGYPEGTLDATGTCWSCRHAIY